MTISVEPDPRVREAEVTEDELIVHLMDGRRVAAPLAWFPRLIKASPKQRANWRISAGGRGLHWPDVDEDLSVAGLLQGNRPGAKGQQAAE